MGEWNGLQKSPVLSDTICVSPRENTGRGSVVLHLPCDSEPSPVGLQPKMGALQKWGIWSAQVISFLFTTVQCSVQFLCLTCCPPHVLFAKKKKTHKKSYSGMFLASGGTPRTVLRRWKQLGATRPGPMIPRVSARHIPSFCDTSVSLLWCYITDWVMLQYWL